MRFLISIFLLASTLAAEAVSTELPKKWWNSSSYFYDKNYQNKWLYHIEITAGYNKENGNIDQEQGQYSLAGILRYGEWSFQVDYTYQHSDITEYSAKESPVGTTKSLGIAYDTYINYDITQIVYTILGHTYYKGDDVYIKNRNVSYTGFGLYALQTETNILKVELLYGYDDIKYLNTLENNGKSNAIAIKEKFYYVYDERIGLDQEFSYIFEEKKYRNEVHFNTKLNVQVVGPLSLVPYISWDYYEFLKLVNMYENDIKLGVNLKIEF